MGLYIFKYINGVSIFVYKPHFVLVILTSNIKLQLLRIIFAGRHGCETLHWMWLKTEHMQSKTDVMILGKTHYVIFGVHHKNRFSLDLIMLLWVWQSKCSKIVNDDQTYFDDIPELICHSNYHSFFVNI